MSHARARVAGVDTHDIRFPISRGPAGSDAVNPAPDHSAAYVVLRTDAPGGPAGHGLALTIGRGDEVRVAAVDALRGRVAGRGVEELRADPGFPAAMRTHSVARYTFPGGTHWAAAASDPRKGQAL